MKVTEIIDEVCEDICDNYCKYPLIYQPDESCNMDPEWIEKMLQEKCDDCPLHNLK